MIISTLQQIADFGWGVASADIVVSNDVVGTISSTRRSMTGMVFDETIGSDSLSNLPDAFRLDVTFGSGPSSPQTAKVDTVDTWDLDASTGDVTLPSNITKYREIRFSSGGAVKALWLEGPVTSGARPVIYFGEAWESEATLYISTRTDLTTSSQRASAATTFLNGLSNPITYVTSVWTIL